MCVCGQTPDRQSKLQYLHGTRYIICELFFWHVRPEQFVGNDVGRKKYNIIYTKKLIFTYIQTNTCSMIAICDNQPMDNNAQRIYQSTISFQKAYSLFVNIYQEFLKQIYNSKILGFLIELAYCKLNTTGLIQYTLSPIILKLFFLFH